MEFFYALLIALANNVDTIGVRMAYSVKGIKVSPAVNLWIALIALGISSLAALAGEIIAGLLPAKLVRVLSMTLLVLIGLWLIIEPYVNKPKKPANRPYHMLEILADPVEADRDHSKHIDFVEATVLGMALSLNNIGSGLSAGILGINWLLMGLLSALISWLIFWAGNQLTDYIKKADWGTKAPVVAGLILIIIGVKQLW